MSDMCCTCCSVTGSGLVVVWSLVCWTCFISRVSDQNGVSLLYVMLEIHHFGREPSICCAVTGGDWVVAGGIVCQT